MPKLNSCQAAKLQKQAKYLYAWQKFVKDSPSDYSDLALGTDHSPLAKEAWLNI
jgi:hypothetical protein